MSYELTLTYEEVNNTVCAQASGPIDYNGRVGMWKKIAEFCDQHGCYNLLIEAELTPLSTVDAFEYSKILETAGIDDKYHVAVAVINQEALDSAEFLDMVLKSNGENLGNVFKDVAKARNWLKMNCKT